MTKTSEDNEYGVVGIGRMGGNLARHALELGIRVVGYTRYPALVRVTASETS